MKKKTLSSTNGLSQSLSETKVGFSQTAGTTKTLSATLGTTTSKNNTLKSTINLFGNENHEKQKEAKLREEKLKKIRLEKQGPIDWSHLGIKLKYRGESQREQLWLEWKRNYDGAVTMTVNARGQIVPVMKIERHPMYEIYYERLGLENVASNERTRSRLLMKRFVLDVQEIWLANLEHLKEHQPDKMFISKGLTGEEDEVEEQNFSRGEGIAYRRDVKEIKEYSSQIQSVSQKRIFTKAYHTAKLPSVNVMLDYVPDPTPFIEETKPTVPMIASVLSSVCFIPSPSSSSSSSTAASGGNQAIHYIPIDSSACLKSSIAFHIDRLIPSNDFARLTDESWWRFTLTNSELLTTRIFITTETEVASFVAQLISSYNDYQQQQNLRPNYEQVFTTGEQYIPIPYEDGTIEWKGKVIIYSFTERKLVKFVVSAEVIPTIDISQVPDFQPIPLHFFCSALEIRHLLHFNPIQLPILDEEWWLQSNRQRDHIENIWKPLLSFLRLEIDHPSKDANKTSLPQGLPDYYHLPINLSFPSEKRLTGYSDCLTNLQTLSCVSELLSAIQLHPLPTASVPTLTISIHPFHTNNTKEEEKEITNRIQLRLQEVDSKYYFQQIPNYYKLKYLEDRRQTSGMQTLSINEDEEEEEEEAEEEEEEVLEERRKTQQEAEEEKKLLDLPNWQEKGKYYFHHGYWESLLEMGPNLSFICNKLSLKYFEVPGGSELGRYGLSFLQDHLFPQVPRTQVAGNYFRDYENSSTNTIFVNLSLAIDITQLFPCLVAWEAFSQLPPPSVGDEVSEIIPSTVIHRSYLYSEYLNSPIEKRLSNTIIIFASVAVEGYDYLLRSTALKPNGYRRHVPIKNEFGFREQIEVSLLQIDPVNDAVVFGITKTGAIPNELKTNSRNIWHSSVAINENINRPRTPKDYIYIILNKIHCGANIPTSYCTRMKANEMTGLTSSAFKNYEENYAKIKELRTIFNRQLALDAKIEKVENDMKIREATIKKKLQNQLQRTLEKKLNKATKSELGWRKRYKTSTLLELQGNWEYRRDDRTGLKFFHRILPDSSREKFVETCQWEVPITWESDVLKQLTANGGQMIGDMPRPPVKTGTVASSLADDRTYLDHLSEVNDPFAEPASTWAPKNGRGMNSTMPGGAAVSGAMSIAGMGGSAGGAALSPGTLTATAKPPVAPGNRSVMSDLDSIRADKSYKESIAATIDTVNLEHIAEQLLSSDEVMKVLAKRLGLPEDQVVPADELSSVFSVDSNHFQQDDKNNAAFTGEDEDGRLPAPREKDIDYIEEMEFHSDDDLWSDEDGEEVGDFDMERYLGVDLPENQLEAAKLRRKETKHLHDHEDAYSVPSQIPFLNFDSIIGNANLEIEHNEERYSWRRLPRPVLTTAFLTNALKTHIRGPDLTSCNTINAPIFLSPISPIDAIQYVPDNHQTAIESLFIPDAKKDMERSIATLQRNIKREEELSRNLATDDLLLFGEAKEFTSAELLVAKQYNKDKAAVSDPIEFAKDAAIMAAKSTNIAQMEDCLAEEVPINTTDDFGNSLLILAAQQGSKRMCKFLLRRGANINQQNLTGNTALHYCYAYSNLELAEYLKSKGADDSIINVDGLTCYEGLNKNDMNKEYADYDEEDYDNEDDGES